MAEMTTQVSMNDYSPIFGKVQRGTRVHVTESINYFYEAFKAMRINYIDIEVEKESEFAAPEKPSNAITLISLGDSYLGKHFFFTFRKDFKEKVEKKEYFCEETKKTYVLTVFFHDNEVAMLKTFFHFMARTRADLSTGWYFEDFDFPYIVHRAYMLEIDEVKDLSPERYVYSAKINDKEKKGGKDFSRHGFRNHCGGMILFDMMWGYVRLQGSHSEGDGLNQTCLRHLGFGKKSVHISDEKWYYEPLDAEDGGFWNFIYYGFMDILLLELLEEKCYILFMFFYISRFTSIEWEKLHHASVVIDMAQMMYKDTTLFLPSKRTLEDADDISLKGGGVENPPPGMIKGYTIVLDTSRQYPNMIRGGNLGVETYIPPEMHEKCKNDPNIVRLGNGEWFLKEPISFASNLVTTVFGLRDFVDGMLAKYDPGDQMYKIWDKIKTVVKNFINTVYGSFANAYTRLFHLPTAQSITYLGRELLAHNKKYTKIAAKYLSEKGIVVNGKRVTVKVQKKYGDTDSIFIWTDSTDKDVVEAVAKFLCEFLNKSFDVFCRNQGMFREYLKLEFESIYYNLFFPMMEGTKRGAKKNYCTWQVYAKGKWLKEPVWKMVGLAGKKSNTPLFAKKVQENLLKTICSLSDREKILEYLKGVVADCEQHFKKKACPKCYSPDIQNITNVRRKCNKCGNEFDKTMLVYDPQLLMKVGIPHRLGRDPKSYKGSQIANKITESIGKYAKRRTRKGETYMYFWTRGERKSIFAFSPENPVIPSNIQIDKSTMMEKLVLAKIDNIIPFFGIDWIDVYSPDGSHRLDSFLKKSC